ncbi:hypothetical protein ACWEK5_28050 [Rhodococcus koreensis]
MFAMIPADGGALPVSGPMPLELLIWLQELLIWLLWLGAAACAVAMVYSVTVLAVMRLRHRLTKKAVAPAKGPVTLPIGSAIGMVVATSSALILTTVAGQ